MSVLALQPSGGAGVCSSRPLHPVAHQCRARRRTVTHCWTVQDPGGQRQQQALRDPQKGSASLDRAAWCSFGTLCTLAGPSSAGAWPWDRQSSLPVPLPSSGFPFSLPYGVDYLLGHPFLTIGLAAGLYIAVPRLWRLFVRVILLPVLIIAAVGFALQHPAASLSFGTKAVGFVTGHPIVVSIAVLAFLAVTLSPYLLIAGFVVALFAGIPSLPGPIRPFVPQPILQAEGTLTSISRTLRGQAKSEAGDLKDSAPVRKLPVLTLHPAPFLAEGLDTGSP